MTTYSNLKNKSQYIGEPAISGGDLVKRGGDYQRVVGINNAILILTGTEAGYWGNLIEPENSKIPGGLEELDGEAITSTFLNRHSAKIEQLLEPLITAEIAKTITVESFNTSSDRIDWTALIVLKDGRKYYFDSENCAGEFR